MDFKTFCLIAYIFSIFCFILLLYITAKINDRPINNLFWKIIIPVSITWPLYLHIIILSIYNTFKKND